MSRAARLRSAATAASASSVCASRSRAVCLISRAKADIMRPRDKTSPDWASACSRWPVTSWVVAEASGQGDDEEEVRARRKGRHGDGAGEERPSPQGFPSDEEDDHPAQRQQDADGRDAHADAQAPTDLGQEDVGGEEHDQGRRRRHFPDQRLVHGPHEVPRRPRPEEDGESRSNEPAAWARSPEHVAGEHVR